MYLHASIGIDPSKLTEIARVKPTKIFAKLFYFLTAGLVGEEQEIETFTAVTILQQLNIALRKQGVTNIVRLTIDGLDLYLDEEGRPDDIDAAMQQVEVQGHVRQDREIAHFNRIVLVLEHRLDHLRLLIQVEIDRVHPPDEFPILVRVDGLLGDFKLGPGETPEALRARMATTFADQDRYDALLANRSGEFEDFVNGLAEAIGEQVHNDALTIEFERRLIRPKRKLGSRADMRQRFGADHDDLLYGYHGFDDAFMYAWLWSELSYDHGVHIREVSLIDEAGQAVLEVGAEGFDAAATSTLDPDAPFEAPSGGDITLVEGSGYEAGSTDTGGWLDSFHDPGSFDFDGGLSSCGGCSSCLSDW